MRKKDERDSLTRFFVCSCGLQDSFEVEIEGEEQQELAALQEQLLEALAETQSLYYRSQQAGAGDKRARIEVS